MRKVFPILLVALIFSSCQQHPVAVSLSGTSPDGKTVINVNGKKQTSLDPLTVTMDVKTNGTSEGSLQFEITASTLDSSDVRFAWSDSNNCLITFTHSDGEKRVFRYYATSTSVLLQEQKKD